MTEQTCLNCKHWDAEYEVTAAEKRAEFLSSKMRRPKESTRPTRSEMQADPEKRKRFGSFCHKLPDTITCWIDGEPLENKITTGHDFGCNQFEEYK